MKQLESSPVIGQIVQESSLWDIETVSGPGISQLVEIIEKNITTAEKDYHGRMKLTVKKDIYWDHGSLGKQGKSEEYYAGLNLVMRAAARLAAEDYLESSDTKEIKEKLISLQNEANYFTGWPLFNKPDSKKTLRGIRLSEAFTEDKQALLSQVKPEIKPRRLIGPSIATLANLALLTSCAVEEGQRAVETESVNQQEQLEQVSTQANIENNNGKEELQSIPTPTRPAFSEGAGGQYKAEQIELIEQGIFSQQEEMLRRWIINYWGSPEAQNRPFLPEAVDMRFIYFFDRNNPENALVALQPGGDYGSRIFYLPIKDGQFMQVPPETPEEQFFIPPGFGPLEISGGEIQLGVVDGKWVRVNETGVVQENLNMDTAQWEEYINFETANWAEDDAGNIDPDILYPIVGSVHNANKRTVDLTDKSSGLKLAVILVEITDPDDANVKQEVVNLLNNQTDLKRQIEEINNQLPENEKNRAIIVINGEDSSQPQITQIAIRSNLPIEKRYLLENGTLRQMLKEEEPLLMAPLSAPDHRFIRTDTGEQVMLRGVNLQHLNWGQFSWNKPERALNVLKGIKEMGANYVVIMWNSGLIEDPVYIESLLNALEYAHNGLGLRVQLDLVSRGLSNPNDPYSDTETGIRNLDEQVTKDWKKLLADSEVALRIGRTVDIFNIISEPANLKISGKQSFFDPVLK